MCSEVVMSLNESQVQKNQQFSEEEIVTLREEFAEASRQIETLKKNQGRSPGR